LSAERSFVFYDPSGRRWIHFRRGLQTAGIFLILVIVLVAIAWLVNPQLPALGLPQVQHLPATISEVPTIISGQKAARNIPFHMRRAAKHIQYQRSNSPVMHPKLAGHVSAGKPVVFGFYVNWDPASMVSLRLNLAHLTHLVPEWLTLENGRGDVTDQTDQTVVTIAEEAKLPILALISNYRDGWRGGEVHQAITNLDARANLIDNIYSNLREHHFQGVNIDFENLSARDREPLVDFMRELYGKLHPEGLLVTESTPVDDPAFDLKRLAQYNDYLLPMLYDEHYQSGTPGPVASEDWFDDQLERLAKVVPADKTVIGIGNYGYDWRIGGHGGAEMSFGDVVAAALGNQGEIHWDAEQSNPVLRYTAGKERHEVWFLDAVTALNQVLHAADYGFRGVGVWRLGGEDPGLWRVLNPEDWPGTNFDSQPLSILSANKVPNRYGEGEVLHISQTPQDGGRNVTREADGDYQETYLKLPSYWVIERTGTAGGKFKAITFDDGPDPKWTPKILDVLRQRNVHATFFVIGANAEQSMGLLRREYAEGHELGNHTYSHPNIAMMGEERTKLELSWTQRIIEHSIGVSTTLFRPPYNADSQPETPEEILPVWRAQRAGYITIAESIDPRDWEAGTTADKILSEVREDRSEGAVILLHDGGGDRSATVAALPLIIDYFREQGYGFKPVGELIGRTRAQVMPVPSSEEMRWAHIEGQAFGVQSNFKKVVGILFLWAIYLTVLRSLVYGSLAVIQKFRARRRRFVAGYHPPVSVIIAAYNEEKVILRTVESILHSGYDDLEIVVVNDGSEDATLQLLLSHYRDHPRVRILDQPNGGKSAALNNAIAHAGHEILVAMDADTILQIGRAHV
jgi:spore germination protein YaaH/peptidoglycan/xylan/chitin deacetylase (PgdA/CDA1 family)